MKILVIRLSALGDVVLTTPILRLLHQQLDAQVDFLTKLEYAAILAEHPHIACVLDIESTDQRQLRSREYDVIIDLQKNLRTLRLCNRLKSRIYRVDKYAYEKWVFYIWKKQLSGRRVVQRYIDAILPLGIVDDGGGLCLASFADQYENISIRQNHKRVIAVVLGGAHKTKRIPLSWIDILVLHSEYHYVLLGGTDVTYDKPVPDHITHGIGRLSLQQSCAVIERCDLVLTGDTGMMHVASAYRKPMVVIWGSTAPSCGFDPYYGNQRSYHVNITPHNLSCHPCSKYGKDHCPKGHLRCLTDISEKEVFDHIKRLLGAQT